ncbi:hypothetical protein C1646_771815 [Rhizophagus diaphanus]|nr:hypothetical protein C1646_771815 [Rhizophagus diaphanus] [Rhizophagus sp. MUCL 43196]
MSSLLGSITNLFGYYLPSLENDLSSDDISSDSHGVPPDNGNHEDNVDYEESDVSGKYDTTSSSFTRWYSASKGFLCYRESSKSNEVEFFNGITYWIGQKNEFSKLSRNWFFIKVDKNETLEEVHKWYTDESIAISFEKNLVKGKEDWAKVLIAITRKKGLQTYKQSYETYHTDSFILTNTIDNNLQIEPNTGDLKCEINGSVIIKILLTLVGPIQKKQSQIL